MNRFTDFYASVHGDESVRPSALGYIPMVIEQSGRGERLTTYTRACSRRGLSFWSGR